MNGYLLVVARDALADGKGEPVLAALRGCVTSSRTGVLVLVDSLRPRRSLAEGHDAAADGADTQRPGLLVVGAPPPYDGRPLKSLLLAAPTHPEDLRLLTDWLRDDDRELVDLPLELSGSLLQVSTVAPRTVGLDADLSGNVPRWQRGQR